MKRVLVAAGVVLVAVSVGYPMTVQAEDTAAGDHKGDMLKKFDKDGDGKLNDAEKAEMKAAWEARRAEREKEMLAQFDTDKDGKLSDEEKAAMKAAMKAKFEKKMLAKFDKDGDGKLNDEEKAAMEKAMSEHKGKGRHQGKD